MYTGDLSRKTETCIKNLSGSNEQIALAAQKYVLGNHYYPAGGDLKMAHALQFKLRKIPGDQYIAGLDHSEYLDCYSANTLLVAILRKAGVPARLVNGEKL